MLSGAFLLIAFIEMGSHAFMDSQDFAAIDDLTVCRVTQDAFPRSDCPDKRQQRQETKNLLDEMTSHCMILTGMVVPHTGIMYRTISAEPKADYPLARALTPPFHPPKQA